MFLAAQTYENASLNFKTRSFLSLKKHVSTGHLRLLITDITVAGVHAGIEKNVQKEVAGTLVALNPAAVITNLHDAFAEFLNKAKADIIDPSTHPIDKVFEKYFAAKAPFG